MIWKKPWHLAEGFLIGAGLMIVGLMLQLSIGPVLWQLFAWPVNIIVLAVLILAITAIFLLRKHVYAFQFLGSYAAAVPALVYAAVLTVIMGLTRQQTNGTWLSDMLTFWPFVLIYTYIVVILGVVILKRVFTSHYSSLGAHLSFLFNHLGLFVALTTATLGNADMKRLQMWTTNNPEMANMFTGAEVFNKYERFAMDENGMKVELPLAIELKQFIMEMYDDSITPRRYASEVVIYSKKSQHQYAATIDVNKPVEVDGWKIYQKDYRLTEAGEACQVSILELVSDPWLPFVYAGIYMMIIGAVMLMTSRRGGTSRLQDIKTSRHQDRKITGHDLG